MSSLINLNSECAVCYRELKLSKRFRYIIFKLSDDLKEIIVEKTGDAYDEFVGNLPEDKPRYAVYDFNYKGPDQNHRSKIVFYFWNPDRSKVRERGLYASNVDDFLSKLDGVGLYIKGATFSEVDYDTVLEKVM
ncbi:uncharacterized protein BX664DRAFT_341620 [Halteromyces radiatus]|uniref:uncharacterized protein n=1 Tax=Halteromyces radiatus TaxID=101107 RepID=UPI00221EC5F6|nr:uncharacterized protein BX664DRAFT_341620 [Halteromyces radiatus]KAI8079855.1 hypothetical protein BX664DRAFT_341620 [Halteromyces radiatus]